MERLVHELEVHRAELEAQNAELRGSRAEAEQALERYTEIFDFAPIGYVLLDDYAKIVTSNHQLSHMLGTTPDRLRGFPFAVYLADESREVLSPLMDRVLHARSRHRARDYSCEATLSIPKKGKAEVRLTAAAMPGSEPHVLIAVVDVSAAKRAERLLREESRRKDDFLATLSHELRNPLAPVRSSVALLRRLESMGDKGLKAIAIIDRQTEHLARIVEDLLDVSRISRGKIHLQRQRLDARETVQRTTEDHRPEFDAAGVALECAVGPEPLWVEADRTRLAQIVGNLLANALKFTPRGGHVALRVSAAQGGAEIRICDDGVGIAPEVREQLFQPFAQGPQSLDRSRGGLGLGLATVKGLAELHGGDVAVESDGLGHGAVFLVRLPVTRAPNGDARGAAQASGTKAVPRRVLIVEDSVDAAEALQHWLGLDGHDVRIAHDGAGGLAIAKRFRPELVLCDLGLPGMDGYEVARAIRSDADLRRASLVALSGYARPEDRQRALEAGFDGHLAKPPDLAELGRLLAAPPHAHLALP